MLIQRNQSRMNCVHSSLPRYIYKVLSNQVLPAMLGQGRAGVSIFTGKEVDSGRWRELARDTQPVNACKAT